MSLRKWHEVYGSPEELRFFIGADRKSGLVRFSFDYRSVAALAKEGKLTTEVTEKIVKKFLGMGIVIASQNKEDHYAYWQRVDPLLGSTKVPSLAKSDKDSRVKKSLAKP